MREMAEYDLKMSRKLREWSVCKRDGSSYLREDPPDDVKEYDKKLTKYYEDLKKACLD